MMKITGNIMDLNDLIVTIEPVCAKRIVEDKMKRTAIWRAASDAEKKDIIEYIHVEIDVLKCCKLCEIDNVLSGVYRRTLFIYAEGERDQINKEV